MLKMDNKSIIYVVCPAFNKTGGTELAHQLVFELNKLKINAYITYYGNDDIKLNPAFEKYVREYKKIDDIIDENNNIIIVPEIKTDLLEQYTNIQKVIWWMSVDNFIKNNGFINHVHYFGILRSIKSLMLGQINFKASKIDNNITHFYQSEYAHQFLINNGIKDSHRLSDYINEEYLETNNHGKRKNNVLYNPKKGLKFTKKIIKQAKNINWLPIQNMTNIEIKELLLNSKVYIDFGNHPGKDRLPREAAILGCCIITSKNGAAAYYEDVTIDDEFKYDDKEENIDLIIKKINDCLLNYEEENQKFDKYKEKIREEKEIFEKDIKEIFGK